MNLRAFFFRRGTAIANLYIHDFTCLTSTSIFRVTVKLLKLCSEPRFALDRTSDAFCQSSRLCKYDGLPHIGPQPLSPEKVRSLEN